MSFYVIESDYDMLLGNDCLKSLNAAVGWQNNKKGVCLNNEWYSLDTLTKIKNEKLDDVEEIGLTEVEIENEDELNDD